MFISTGMKVERWLEACSLQVGTYFRIYLHVLVIFRKLTPFVLFTPANTDYPKTNLLIGFGRLSTMLTLAIARLTSMDYCWFMTAILCIFLRFVLRFFTYLLLP